MEAFDNTLAVDVDLCGTCPCEIYARLHPTSHLQTTEINKWLEVLCELR